MPLSLLRREILTEPSLRHIVEHKYKGGDYTAVDSLLNPWWNWVASHMPLWLAPNTITLIGLLSVLSTVVVAALFSSPHPDGGSMSSVPAGVHLFIAFVEFFYQTMDAVDGKQARRTNSSSPLGQLFDHGCDCIVTAVLIHHLCSAVGLSHTLYEPLILVLGLSVFYLAQYEETVTGTLRTNVGQFGVTEAQLLTISVHLFAAWSGPAVFAKPLSSFLPGLSFLPPSMRLGEAIGTLMLAIIIFAAVAVIFKAVISTTKSIRKTLLPVVPTFILGAATIAIFLRATVAPSFKLGVGSAGTSLGREVPGIVLLTFAISAIHLSTKTIVFGMAKQPYGPAQLMSLTVPLLLCLDVLDTGLAQASSALILLLTFIGYLSLVSSFVLQISHALGIKVFKVRPMQPREMLPHAGEAPTTVPEAGTFAKPGTVRTVEVETEGKEGKEAAPARVRMRVKSGLVSENQQEGEGKKKTKSVTTGGGGGGGGGGASTVPSGEGQRRTRAAFAAAGVSASTAAQSPSPSPSPSSSSSSRRRQGSRARDATTASGKKQR